MEGTENNKCLPSDLWMSQIDPQFSGNLAGAAMRDARTKSSPTHLDLSRKQPPLYSNYDLSSVHYKQNAQAVTSSVMQQFPQASTRSAWVFGGEDFSSASKDFAPQSLPQSATTAGSQYSQSVHDYAFERNVSQPQERRFPPSSISQPQRGYLGENLLSQQPVGNYAPQDTQQSIREPTAHSLAQQTVREPTGHSLPLQNARTDRSVWSHLYSLDPSIASYGITSQPAHNTNLTQEKPYSYTLSRTEVAGASNMALKMAAVPTEKSALILGKATSADQASSSYINRSSIPADNIPISSLAPTLYSNVIGSANVEKQKMSMSYEDEIGGYSPVSPPTHDVSSSPYSDLPNDRSAAALSLKSDRYMASSSASDFSSTSKTLPVNQFLHSDPIVSNPSLLQLSHDVPLDMSKGWSSHSPARTTPALIACSSDTRMSPSVTQNSYQLSVSKEIISNESSNADKPTTVFSTNQSGALQNPVRTGSNDPSVFSGNQLALNKTNNPPSSTLSDLLSSPYNFATNKLANPLSVNQFPASNTNDTTSVSPMATVKDLTDTQTGNQFSANNCVDVRSAHLFPGTKPKAGSLANQSVSNEPVETTAAIPSNFPQRTAPKKSNFYGRDASFFSVSPASDQPQVDVMRNNNTVISSSESVLSTSNVKMEPLLAQTVSSSGLTQTLGTDKSKVFVSEESLMPSNIESDGTSFADSFIDATTAPCPSDDKPLVENFMIVEKKDNNVDISSSSETKREDKEEKGNNNVHALESVACPDNVSYKVETNDQVVYEAGLNAGVEEDPSLIFNVPTTLAGVRGGKTARGRKRRGGATQRRQPKKTGKRAAVVLEPVATELDFSGMKDHSGGVVNAETVPCIITQPVQKARARRGRKRNLAEATNPDSEGSNTRRSSSRRSKDNAMRLIELQAESIYGHGPKPAAEEPATEPVLEPPQQPSAKPRRKAATAAAKSSTFSDNRDEEDLIDEKDDSSDEMSDGKDADYAVDEEEVEAMEKDMLLDIAKDQKKPMVLEKKTGGLKISIKLGVDSSAEIVSGLDKSPPRKKKKVVKKKTVSHKFKSKAIIQDDDEEEEEEEESMSTTKMESEKNKSDSGGLEPKEKDKDDEKGMANEIEEKGDVVDKHNSLMDKYFSSATQARPVQKPIKKDGRPKKQDAKSKVSKTAKGTASKTNSVPASQSSSDGTKPVADNTTSSSDSGVPKFVCGYCPNRYHNKQELLSHMEDHMAEMEDKPSKSSDNDSSSSISKETKKQPTPQSSKKQDGGKSTVLKKNEGSEAVKYNCGECGKSFSSKPNLLDHVRTHAAEKPFECNLCHKFFKERDQLSAHRKVHAQEGLFRCQFCQKGFVNNADLTIHMESHPKRTKSALLYSKQPVSDSAKKTLTLVSNSGKKNLNHVSDPSKKITKTQPVSRDKEVPVPKPKSFASALEPSLEKTKDNPTLLLRRNDGSSSSSKDESFKTGKSFKPLPNSSKPVKEEIKKSSSSKLGDGKRDSKDTLNVKKEVKDVKKEPKEVKSFDEKPKTGGETIVPSKESVAGECTCQECPECVTRFLNSFD